MTITLADIRAQGFEIETGAISNVAPVGIQNLAIGPGSRLPLAREHNLDITKVHLATMADLLDTVVSTAEDIERFRGFLLKKYNQYAPPTEQSLVVNPPASVQSA